jgi:hypothetical protein
LQPARAGLTEPACEGSCLRLAGGDALSHDQTIVVSVDMYLQITSPLVRSS